MMTDGSLQASEGRDAFLIYDPATGKLRPGKVDFGITKERYREDGCWHATMTHFLIADANRDGLADIGVVKEQIRCPEGEDAWEGEFYEQHALHWYLYTAAGWKPEKYRSSWSDNYSELPLVGLALSPVDYVGDGLWKTYDPTFWKNPPHYVPEYWKKMIAEQAQSTPQEP